MLTSFASMDGKILLWIQETIRTDFLTPIVQFITSLGDKGFIWILLSVLLLIPKKTRKVGLTAIIALILSFIVNNAFLKIVVARTRPYEVVSGLTLITRVPTDYSFPSGHSASSFAAAIVFYKMLPKRFGIPAMVLASFIALSRLYVGVHYPTDVLCGIISGILLGFAACAIGKRLLKGRV